MINYFKNLSKKGMLAWTACSYIVYFLLAIVAPVITVCIKFKLFSTVETKAGIGGWALILIIVATIVSMFVLRRAINKLSDLRPAAAYFKYTLDTISHMIAPVGVILILNLMNTDFTLVRNTLYIMMLFYISAELIDGMIINYIDRENKIRNGALYDKEKAARADKV